MTLQALLKTNMPQLKRAIAELSAGQCVAIPTETVYGLAADATNGEAVARIFEMKGRPKFNPLICHVSGLEMAQDHGQFNALAISLAKHFWPGPLTIVVPLNKSSTIHPLVTAGLDSVGLRYPAGEAANLIYTFGKPLAAPSANRSGKISPTTPQHVREEFDGSELFIVDGGACDVGLESTIVKVEDRRLTILRPGGITADMIEAATGVTPRDYEGTKIEAPGMMKSHYAPNAKVLMNCETAPDGAAWLQFGSAQPTSGPSLNLSPAGELREAAANLYNYLKQLDASDTNTICVSPIPEEGLGLAINDRLRRAAAPREA